MIGSTRTFFIIRAEISTGAWVHGTNKYKITWISERRGNCFVHAKVLQAVLNKKGITNKLIWTKDKSHYWNLVYVGGHWRHYDSTPGNLYVGLTDEVMATKAPVKNGGGWDPSVWPAAN